MLAYLPYLALPFGLAGGLAALIVLMGNRPTMTGPKIVVPTAKPRPTLPVARLSPRWAGAALPVAFLAAWLWQRGWPSLALLSDRTALLVLAGLVVGGVLDGVHRSRPCGRALGYCIVAVFAVLAVAWLADVRGYGAGLGWFRIVPLVGLWLAVLVPLRAAMDSPMTGLENPAGVSPRRGNTAVGLLAVLGAGIALVAEAAGVPLGIWPGLALMAASMGYLVVRWPLRLPLPWSVVLGGGGAAAGLMETLFHRHPSPSLALALAVLLLIPSAGPTSVRLTVRSPALAPLVAFGLAALPLGLATIVARGL